MLVSAENFGTRIPFALAQKIHAFADKNAMSESAVVRLAVKRFFENPRADLTNPTPSIESEPAQEG